MADLEAIASGWIEAEIDLATARIANVKRELADAKTSVAISEGALTKATAIYEAMTLLASRWDHARSTTKEDQ